MLRISLEQWRMFRSIVEFGGFNQGSQGLHKSQSNSHTVFGQIEGRKTVLTEEGKLMLRRANFLLGEAEKIEALWFDLPLVKKA
ncbi:hypothetical protein ACOYR1_16705 [Thalassotalea piscium]